MANLSGIKTYLRPRTDRPRRGPDAFQLAALWAAVLCLGLWAPGSAWAQIGQVTEAGRAQVLAHPAAPFAGAAAADVTVVEYLDFNCPYCKKAAVSLQQLIAGDPKIRVLYKDWPIFGGVSTFAARATLAAGYQGRYMAAHNILIDSPSRLATEDQVRQRLAFAGVDPQQLDRDLISHARAIDAVLARNHQEALALGFTGTPGLLVGDFVVPGAVDLDALRQLAKASRTKDRPAPRA
jgi:protein-disulfide isomerase